MKNKINNNMTSMSNKKMMTKNETPCLRKKPRAMMKKTIHKTDKHKLDKKKKMIGLMR